MCWRGGTTGFRWVLVVVLLALAALFGTTVVESASRAPAAASFHVGSPVEADGAAGEAQDEEEHCEVLGLLCLCALVVSGLLFSRRGRWLFSVRLERRVLRRVLARITRWTPGVPDGPLAWGVCRT